MNVAAKWGIEALGHVAKQRVDPRLALQPKPALLECGLRSPLKRYARVDVAPVGVAVVCDEHAAQYPGVHDRYFREAAVRQPDGSRNGGGYWSASGTKAAASCRAASIAESPLLSGVARRV